MLARMENNPRRGVVALLAALSLCSAARSALADVVRLDELPLDAIHQDWGTPRANLSVQANPMSIAGQAYEHGVGTHAGSAWWFELDGNAQKFIATVGVDDEVKRDARARAATVEFKVVGERGVLWRSGDMRVGDAAKRAEVDLSGHKRVGLIVSATGDRIDFTHANWADASLVFAGARPMPAQAPQEPREILTPPAPPTPRLTGPTVFGVRPDRPIVFTVTATGERPMTFEASGLPGGVALDGATGSLTGRVAAAGSHEVIVRATNARGTSERKLKLVVGDRISLTPPMGWNSWNCFAGDVSDEKMRQAADAMISSGLANHGWSYINLDDCWQVSGQEPREKRRDANGRVLTNPKFPDMKALADYVHAKGLKIGTYSSPGVVTCANFEGSLQHELDDARQYAEWGFDYLKYDWCSYGRVADAKIRATNDPAAKRELHRHPYDVMRDALAQQSRDIVYSLCQYGMNDVWEWGAQAGGQLWRTTGDITDTWNSMSGIGFGQAKLAPHAQPGQWNDPDMLVIGKVGWGGNLRDSRLTPNEQYTHVTLWSLLSAPLLIGCDLTRLDPFTLGLLTNDEVIAVNQDALGKQASRALRDEATESEVWAKDLEDGSKAVGLFNRGEMATTISLKWSDLGLSGAQQARDLWRQKDVESSADGYTVEVPRHGCVMLKVSPKP